MTTLPFHEALPELLANPELLYHTLLHATDHPLFRAATVLDLPEYQKGKDVAFLEKFEAWFRTLSDEESMILNASDVMPVGTRTAAALFEFSRS